MDEQTEPYELTIQVLTPPQSLVGDIGVIITATDGSAIRESIPDCTVIVLGVTQYHDYLQVEMIIRW